MKTINESIVVDSNVFISSILFKNSVPNRAVQKALAASQLLVSQSLLDEIDRVLFRSKFDRYTTAGERLEFLNFIKSSATLIPITQTIQACRDPKDNMILEVAINGNADLIITGDLDLLALSSFQSISIITPSQYLAF